jgi:hypothetical protein
MHTLLHRDDTQSVVTYEIQPDNMSHTITAEGSHFLEIISPGNPSRQPR